MIICFFYTYSSTRLKEFKEEVVETKHISDNINFEISKIKEGKYIINCKLKKDNLEKKEYFNYVSGKGEGYIINYSILVKIQNDYFMAKTIKTGTDNEYIEFSACAEDPNINPESKISLYDINRKLILEY